MCGRSCGTDAFDRPTSASRILGHDFYIFEIELATRKNSLAVHTIGEFH